MSLQHGARSPVSVDGSDWSGLNQYQKLDTTFSPTAPSGRSNLATPPVSGGPMSGNGGTGPRRPSDSGNPSPPGSVAARSSIGTLSDQQSRRYQRMEESLGQHYSALRRFLGNPHASERAAMKSNKARDKLLRLSPTQFHELSTDVFDELVRRQQAAGGPGRPPRSDVPPFLPPRDTFHEKRNQARQKLASLQPGRFKDLSTDVFIELERRFPQFAGPDVPRVGSPSPSIRSGPPPNGYPGRSGSNGYPPNGYPGGPRPTSRGPGGRGPPPPNGRFPPRQHSLHSLNGAPIGGGQPGPDIGLTAKSFQSNTIVPNKSTLVEDDEDSGTLDDYDDDGRSDAFALDGVLPSRRGTVTTIGEKEKLLVETQGQVSSLQGRIEELEKELKSKDEDIARLQAEQEKSQLSDLERQQWEDSKAEFEAQIAAAEEINNNLQSQLEEERRKQANLERTLRAELEEAQSQAGDTQLLAQFNDLQRRHQSLQVQLQEQQKTTDEVRRDAANFLKEMRAMSERSNATWEREEKLSRDVNRLEEEVKEWKSRYINAKTQLRHLRSSVVGISGMRSDVGSLAKENELIQPTGLVKDTHVTKFQVSIDDLLRVARSGEPQLVLDQVKVVVVAVRHVTGDVEASFPEGAELPHNEKKAKSRVSATANNLITASKNFANSSGLSPVSLLDAAASHLSIAVIELLQLVKICSTPGEQFEEDEADIAPMQSPGYFSVTHSRGLSNNESIYSAISSPSVRSRSQILSRRPQSRGGAIGISTPAVTNNKGSFGLRTHDNDLEELKLYLDDQTENLIHPIQSLIASVRAGDETAIIQNHIAAISTVVGNVVASTSESMNKPGAKPSLRARASPVVQNLASCRDRLSKVAAAGVAIPDASNLREVTSKLPPIAFEIAREVKELVQRIESLEFDEAEEDDFR